MIEFLSGWNSWDNKIHHRRCGCPWFRPVATQMPPESMTVEHTIKEHDSSISEDHMHQCSSKSLSIQWQELCTSLVLKVTWALIVQARLVHYGYKYITWSHTMHVS